jgi:hypothetical protein
MTILRKVKTLAVSSALLLASALSVAAATVGGDYLGGGTVGTFSSATGFQFTVGSSDITVTGLGLFDYGSDGFADGHTAALFAVSNPTVALASVSLGSGTSGTFVAGTVDGSRFESIPALTLTAGTSYYMLADNFSVDQFVYGTVAYDLAITWNGYVDGSANSVFSTPSFNGGLPGNLGPNLLFTVGSTPLPAAFPLFASGLGALGLIGWRRKRKAQVA